MEFRVSRRADDGFSERNVNLQLQVALGVRPATDYRRRFPLMKSAARLAVSIPAERSTPVRALISRVGPRKATANGIPSVPAARDALLRAERQPAVESSASRAVRERLAVSRRP